MQTEFSTRTEGKERWCPVAKAVGFSGLSSSLCCAFGWIGLTLTLHEVLGIFLAFWHFPTWNMSLLAKHMWDHLWAFMHLNQSTYVCPRCTWRPSNIGIKHPPEACHLEKQRRSTLGKKENISKRPSCSICRSLLDLPIAAIRHQILPPLQSWASRAPTEHHEVPAHVKAYTTRREPQALEAQPCANLLLNHWI